MRALTHHCNPAMIRDLLVDQLAVRDHYYFVEQARRHRIIISMTDHGFLPSTCISLAGKRVAAYRAGIMATVFMFLLSPPILPENKYI